MEILIFALLAFIMANILPNIGNVGKERARGARNLPRGGSTTQQTPRSKSTRIRLEGAPFAKPPKISEISEDVPETLQISPEYTDSDQVIAENLIAEKPDAFPFVNQDNLVMAVVMKEILGPPKARIWRRYISD
jgi:hypothetical protein